VGVGRVRGTAEELANFRLPNGSDELVPAIQVLAQGQYHRDQIDDPDKTEYFVPVEWLETVSLSGAINEVGLFGNQNTVCAPRTPRWRHTIDRLKAAFPSYSRDE
jgi:hypothetical protein